MRVIQEVSLNPERVGNAQIRGKKAISAPMSRRIIVQSLPSTLLKDGSKWWGKFPDGPTIFLVALFSLVRSEITL